MKLSYNFLKRYDHTKEVWMHFLSDEPKSLRFDDDNFNWLFAIHFSLYNFSEVPLHIRDDKEVALALINSSKFIEGNISSFKHLTKRVKSDNRIWLEALKRNSNVLRYFDEDILVDESFYLTLFRRKDWLSLIGVIHEDHPLINQNILSKISFGRVQLEVRLEIYLEFKYLQEEDIFLLSLLSKILLLKPRHVNDAEEIIGRKYLF